MEKQKIGWFRRLFKSWSFYVNYFAAQPDEELIKENQELREQKASLEATLNATSKSLNDRLEDYKRWQTDKARELDEKSTELAKISKKLDELLAQNKSLESDKNERELRLSLQDSELNVLKDKLRETQTRMEETRNDISKKLEPLAKIDRTFFGASGNKGKGEFGELQLKTWLEKSGMDHDMWIENLIAGSTQYQVEFAIRAGMNDKWIPVDSKVLDPEYDEVNNIIITEAYRNKVLAAAKEVAKYLGKSNTTDYGLLVLQNDNIYIKLFEDNPVFFEQVIKDYKVYICSPSTFIQYAWSMSNILAIYKKINADEKLFDEVVDVLVSVQKFAISMEKTHQSFDIAMETHYPTLKKRHDRLAMKLEKTGKIKRLPDMSKNSSETPEDLLEQK